MNFFFILVLSACLLASAWLMYRLLYVKKRSRRLAEQKFRIFEDLIRKLAEQRQITNDEVVMLAENPSTRDPLFRILERFNKGSLFPAEFYTLEKSAESFMVNWLEFPTELSTTPDKIELFTNVFLPEEPDLQYYVFKFKKSADEYRVGEDWMLGVVGPFASDSKPYDVPARIFSRFNALGTVSALNEVRWVHENINRK